MGLDGDVVVEEEQELAAGLVDEEVAGRARQRPVDEAHPGLGQPRGDGVGDVVGRRRSRRGARRAAGRPGPRGSPGRRRAGEASAGDDADGDPGRRRGPARPIDAQSSRARRPAGAGTYTVARPRRRRADSVDGGEHVRRWPGGARWRDVRSLARASCSSRTRSRPRGPPGRSPTRSPAATSGSCVASTGWCGRSPTSPTRRLLDAAGLEPGDVGALVADQGLVGALERPARRRGLRHLRGVPGRGRRAAGQHAGSWSRPPDFFNPVAAADYLATTGGSRERRDAGRGLVRVAAPPGDAAGDPARHDRRSAARPLAIWLPVFPSAAGFGAVMKIAAGRQHARSAGSPRSDAGIAGVSSHKRLANRFLPAALRFGRTGLPRPEHVPTSRPRAGRDLAAGDAVERHGAAGITGYASSITAAARWALDHGVDLTGVVTYPEQRAGDAGKLAVMRAAGMTPEPDVRLHARGHDGHRLRPLRRRGVPPVGPRAGGRDPPPVPGRRHRGRRLLLDQPGRRGAPGAGQRGERRLRGHRARRRLRLPARPAGPAHPRLATSGGSARSWRPGSASRAGPSTTWPRSVLPDSTRRRRRATTSSSRRPRTGTPSSSLRIAPRASGEVDEAVARGVVRELVTQRRVRRARRCGLGPGRRCGCSGVRPQRDQGGQDPVLSTSGDPACQDPAARHQQEQHREPQLDRRRFLKASLATTLRRRRVAASSPPAATTTRPAAAARQRAAAAT